MTKMVAETPVGVNIARRTKTDILKRIKEANDEAQRTGKLVTLTNVEITADIASDILSANKENRPDSEKTAQGYAAIMKAGNWVENGDPIRIRVDFLLADGQHRLKAVELCGVPLVANIVCGLQKKAMATIDLQKRRTAGDYIYLNNIYKSKPNVLAGAINLHLLIIHNGQVTGRVSMDRVNTQNVELFLKNETRKKEMIMCVDEAVKRLSKEGKFLTPSQWGALYYNLHKQHPGEAKKFINGLATGDNLDSTDKKTSAIYYLHRELLNQMATRKKDAHAAKVNAQATLFGKFYLIHKAWNKFRAGMRTTAHELNLTSEEKKARMLPVLAD